MRICIIGGGLTSLALAKALVNQNIYVDLLTDKKKQIKSIFGVQNFSLQKIL